MTKTLDEIALEELREIISQGEELGASFVRVCERTLERRLQNTPPEMLVPLVEGRAGVETSMRELLDELRACERELVAQIEDAKRGHWDTALNAAEGGGA